MPIPRPKLEAVPHRPLLRDVVEERIRTAVLDGILQPGEALGDKEMQEWLGVSRTPIRDALNELARAGLIEMVPNRYTKVATPRAEDALESTHALGVLLGGVLRLSVGQMSSDTTQKAITKLERIGDDLRDENFADARKRMLQLWDWLAQLTGNRQPQRMYKSSAYGLFYRIPAEFFFSLRADKNSEQRLLALVTAIKSNDAIAAELAIEALVWVP